MQRLPHSGATALGQGQQPLRSFKLTNGETKRTSTTTQDARRHSPSCCFTPGAPFPIPRSETLASDQKKKKMSFAVAKRFPVVFRLPLRLFLAGKSAWKHLKNLFSTPDKAFKGEYFQFVKTSKACRRLFNKTGAAQRVCVIKNNCTGLHDFCYSSSGN